MHAIPRWWDCTFPRFPRPSAAQYMNARARRSTAQSPGARTARPVPLSIPPVAGRPFSWLDIARLHEYRQRRFGRAEAPAPIHHGPGVAPSFLADQRYGLRTVSPPVVQRGVDRPRLFCPRCRGNRPGASLGRVRPRTGSVDRTRQTDQRRASVTCHSTTPPCRRPERRRASASPTQRPALGALRLRQVCSAVDATRQCVYARVCHSANVRGHPARLRSPSTRYRRLGSCLTLAHGSTRRFEKV